VLAGFGGDAGGVFLNWKDDIELSFRNEGKIGEDERFKV
jgi:hypothetical protein